MGVTGLVLLPTALQAACNVLSPGQTATGQKAPGHHAQAELGLIEPRAMFRGAMKAMPVAGIGPQGSALWACLERSRLKGSLAPLGHQAADGQTPVGV
jgi:hypothetical protein